VDSKATEKKVSDSVTSEFKAKREKAKEKHKAAAKALKPAKEKQGPENPEPNEPSGTVPEEKRGRGSLDTPLSGVYAEENCERIDCPLKAPIEAHLFVVPCPDGWRGSFHFEIPDAPVEGYMPNTENPARPTRLYAVAAAADELAARMGYIQDTSAGRTRQALKAAKALEKWARSLTAVVAPQSAPPEAPKADSAQRGGGSGPLPGSNVTVVQTGEKTKFIQPAAPQPAAAPSAFAQPNADGEFDAADCNELVCPVAGIEAKLFTVRCVDGWRKGGFAKLPTGKGVTGLPEASDKVFPTEQEALKAAAKLMVSFAKSQEKREGITPAKKAKAHKEAARKLREWAELVMEESGK
jgi:hypothetical protein